MTVSLSAKYLGAKPLSTRLLTISHLGLSCYEETLANMQAYTHRRDHNSDDLLWLTEHPPVYTLGLNRRNIRLPQNNIPIVMSDRGGKITYHGPGQLIIYGLMDLKRLGLNIRDWITLLEQTVIEWLATQQVSAQARSDAPGVYVNGEKIASLGLRLKNQYCYHGLSLNVDMDLTPFLDIDPCGYAGMRMTQTKALNIALPMSQIADELITGIQEKIMHVR